MAYTTIDDPSAHFQIATWSGDDATTQNITNDGNSDLQPDLVWVKCRNTSGNGFDHTVWDTSRGVDNNVNKSLSPSQSDSEGLGDNVTTTAQLGGVSAMLSDGFTVREGSVDDDSRYVNENSRTYVAWQWKANGGTTSSNTDGSVTVTLQANTTAGFSIGTFTSNGNTSGTIGHGLGARPDIVITKERDDTGNWNVIVPDYAGNQMGFLQTNAAFGVASGINTVGSSTFTDGDGADSNDRVFYAWRSIQGYSKIGTYTGNGNADGTFIYTGFKPAWLLTKDTGSTEQWQIKDTTRYPNNPNYYPLYPNLSNAENNNTNSSVDFLSNGFKIRNNDGSHNTSGNTYIYMAFAEYPFVSSEGVPCTAR